MGWNVPDDWGSYYYNCSRCGSRYHASEGGCGCLDDHVECAGGADCYVHVDEVIEFDGRDYCEEHLACDGCGEPEGLTPFEGDIYCEACMTVDA